jgi:hypothetical protein
MATSLSQERAYMRFIEVELRRRLNVPEGWVQTAADEDHGWVVNVALDMEIEDVGDGESGPRISASPNRFVTVSVSDQDRWFVHLFDLTEADAYEPPVAIATLHVQDLDGVLRWERVASVIGDILDTFRAAYRGEI